ncbi:MAG: insulinase family protein [Granulosicoccaceae bacterium]
MNHMSSHPSFEHLRSSQIKSLDIDVHEFRHKKTGAPHIHLSTDNTENVFLVGLRTIPTDSTGVAHILEHTVLCGSEKYPVRDPFFMMIRRSLNTFMNAFTSSDWTAYPFASQNRKDYFNLLDVYLDAVFFSNLDELDFSQEGHRIEFEKADDPQSDLVFKGVVFNEMKGAMSAPTSILWDAIGSHLFPNNTYHFNSGGDPEVIPELSYKALREFYETHYHPSNSVFMTYGDIPPAELQERFDTAALSRFEPLGREISVAKTHRFHSPKRIEDAYAIQDEETKDKTHIVMGWLLSESTNLDERLQAHLLSSVLLDNSASPLLQALEQTDLGNAPSPLCGVEDSALEMVFVCGLDGSNPEARDATEKLIIDVLEKIAKDGVEQEQVDAVLHQLELSQREIRGDGMPFGLQLVLSGLSAAMHRGDTLEALDLDPALQRLREKAADPKFIPQLVNHLLLNNHHRVTLTLKPDSAISQRRVIAEKARLAEIKQGLDKGETQYIVDYAKKLADRQIQEDDPSILPQVTLEDIPANFNIAQARNDKLKAGPVSVYHQGTNGLVYQHVVQPLPHLNEQLQRALPFYTGFLAEFGSGGRDYLQTQKRQAEVTGGIGAYTVQRGSVDNEQDVKGHMIVRGKALLPNSEALSELINDTMNNVRFDEHERLRELISQARMSREQSVTGSGHMLAMMAASSGMSPTAHWSHELSGLEGIKSLKQLDDSLSDKGELTELAGKLSEIHEIMKASPREFMVVSEAENWPAIKQQMNNIFKNSGSSNAQAFEPMKAESIRKQVRQLWTTNTEVNFCASAFPAVTSSHEDAATLSVLGPVLRNGYLHRAIRETGGAYGGGASFDADSASFRFYSYRDPRLSETLEDFSKSIEWLNSTDLDPRLLEEAILNVISSIDKPGSPAGEARNAYQNELTGRSASFRQEFRQRILKVSMDDLKSAGCRYFGADKASIAVVTNAEHAAAQDVMDLKLDLCEL